MTEVEYTVEVTTGAFTHSGTISDVYLILHGNLASSEMIVLNRCLGHNLYANKVQSLKTKQPDLGDIWGAQFVKFDKGPYAEWLLEILRVTGNGREFYFPYYGWLHNGAYFVREGTARLEKDDAYKEERKKQTLAAQRLYVYTPGEKGTPSVIKGLASEIPYNERWNDDKVHDLKVAAKQAVASIGLETLKNLFDKWNHMDDFDKLFVHHFHKPELQKSWMSDETFGRERLYGGLLTQFRRIDEIPKKFGVTTEMVQNLLRPGKTLEEEAKCKRIYFVDYEILEGLPFQKGRWMATPMALFYLNGDDKFVPLAIQLFQEPNPEWNPVYTPNDPKNDWLFAKMWLGNADFGYFQAITHYGLAHLSTESIVMSTNRILPPNHPVYKLLKPHFKYHLGINAMGRTTLFNPKGLVPKISSVDYDAAMTALKRFFDTWKFEHQDIHWQLQDRKIPGNDELPNYHYRDDSLAMWSAIEKFAKKVLSIFYKSDDDVKNDAEIQEWARDIEKVGYSGQGKFPEKIESLDKLVQICTTYIFNGCAHHSVVNFAQYESFSYVPLTPSSIFIPPPGYDKKPVVKGKITIDQIFQALPKKKFALRQMAQMYVLTRYSDINEFIGDYREFWFNEKEVLIAKEEFQKDIRELGEFIHKRGWDHLHPKKCPSSVAN